MDYISNFSQSVMSIMNSPGYHFFIYVYVLYYIFDYEHPDYNKKSNHQPTAEPQATASGMSESETNIRSLASSFVQVIWAGFCWQ